MAKREVDFKFFGHQRFVVSDLAERSFSQLVAAIQLYPLVPTPDIASPEKEIPCNFSTLALDLQGF